MTARRDWLLGLITLWLAVTMILVWLPFVRCVMDGESYQWGATWFGSFFHGAGTGGDFWLLAVMTAVGLPLLVLGVRGGAQPFPAFVLIWTGVHAANAIHAALTATEPVIFQGDTLGIRADITWVAPAANGVFFVLTAIWALPRLMRGGVWHLGWNRWNAALLIIVLALLPVNYVLLSTGEPHGRTDQVGVILTIAQIFVFVLALRPPRPRA